MRKIITLLAVGALLISAATVYAATTNVSWKVGTSKTVTIRKGGSVKWVWADHQPHNLKGPGVSTSVSSKKGHTFTRKFTKRGKFTYICQVHPSMKTVVTVR